MKEFRFWELEQGHCWLEYDENGKVIRSFEMCFIKITFKSGRGASEDIVLIESHESVEGSPIPWYSSSSGFCTWFDHKSSKGHSQDVARQFVFSKALLCNPLTVGV